MPPKGFRDESMSMLKLFFDKWGIKYDITSYTNNDCIGSHGAVYTPAFNTGKATTYGYDGIVLIDGEGIDAYKLFDYRPLLDLMMLFNQNSKFILGIGNASKIPARANIIKDKRLCAADSETRRLVALFHGKPSDEPFELAGNVITIKDSRSIEDSMQRILQHMGVA